MNAISLFWYRRSHSFFSILLLPLSWMFQSIVAVRHFFYRTKLLKTNHFPVPIIVVGNITVGGTGKTPLVIWLANFLKDNGYKPGIVSRGYGGKKHYSPKRVGVSDDARTVGDEALLLARNSRCPLVICINRVSAVKELLEKTDCNIVITDDGLQHYRLGRDIEIAVVDSERQFGNACFLPAGPLRESISRLNRVDFVIQNGGAMEQPSSMELVGERLVSLKEGNEILLSHFRHATVHGIAGIGNSGRFFSVLRSKGLYVIEHSFPDHYHYRASDFIFDDTLPILMTEKDAVKCQLFSDARFWFLPVTAKINPLFENALLAKLKILGEKSNVFY